MIFQIVKKNPAGCASVGIGVCFSFGFDNRYVNI